MTTSSAECCRCCAGRSPTGWVLFVRSHVDVTEPHLTALRALVQVREQVRDVLTLQLVAFPQEGIVSFDGGEKLLEEAVRLGVDVVGAIPHYEDTREDGIRSVEIAVDLAARHGLRVDAHCDEIDDEQSRFVEVLATLAHRTGLRSRVTASHTTAMGSYNAAYSYKLRRILARSGINVVSNPMVNLHLQGRFDGYPKRRGLTQVKELLAAGVNVAFGHDDVMDPWFPLGTADPCQIALVGALANQLTAPAEIAECYRAVTDRAAPGARGRGPWTSGGRRTGERRAQLYDLHDLVDDERFGFSEPSVRPGGGHVAGSGDRGPRDGGADGTGGPVRNLTNLGRGNVSVADNV